MPKREMETKIRIGNLEEIEDGLQEMGARPVEEQRNVVSLNVFFDNEGGRLKEAGELFRVRGLRAENGEPVMDLITWKGKRLHPNDPIFKEKPEENIELELGKAEATIAILQEKVGLKVVERLEYTVISTWHWKNVEIALKKIPFLGFFMEPEGPEAKIRELFELLGLDISRATSKRYEELWVDFCREKGIRYDLTRFTFDYEEETTRSG